MRVVLTLGPDQGAVAAEARAAEDAGYDGVATGEHLFFHGPVTNGFVTLAAAAGATTRIRLLSSLTVLPLYPAALAAKLATTLDQVSNGRFDLGVGVGGEHPPEFVAAGAEVTERGARADEGLELMRQLWSGGPVDFAGRFTTRPGPHPGPGTGAGRGPADLAGRTAPRGHPPGRTLRRRLDAVHVFTGAGGLEPGRGAGGCRGGGPGSGRHPRRRLLLGRRRHRPRPSRREVVDGVERGLPAGLHPARRPVPSARRPRPAGGPHREYADAGAETLIFSPVGAGDRRQEIVDLFTTAVHPRLRPAV